MTVGETFGEEELIEKTKRKSCVRCITSSGELYMLNRKVFSLINFNNIQEKNHFFKEFYRRVMTDESATQWLLKQIKIRASSRKKRVQNFIAKEIKFVLPKNKQNLEHFLGDFTKMNLNTSTLKNSSIDFSKKEIYSKESNQDLDYFLPPTKGLENLEKNTLIPSKVSLDIKNVLFQNSLSPNQEKFQGNAIRKFKLFMKEYDNNKVSLKIARKTNFSRSLKSQITSPKRSKNAVQTHDLEIPFLSKAANILHNAENEEKKEENDKRRNSSDTMKLLYISDDKSSHISPKINNFNFNNRFNAFKEIPLNIKNKLLQHEENYERSSDGWLSLVQKKGKAVSMSLSSFGQKLNVSEEREKMNRFIMESLKGCSNEVKKHQKTVSFSFQNIKKKFQGNRYTNLFQNLG